MAEYDRCHRAVLSQGGQWPICPIRWRPCCVFTACSIGQPDGAMEDALANEIASMRLFARLSPDSALPDRTTIMNFRHLLEQHQLARQLFKTINRWLAEAGVMMTCTLVDATIIEAPSSTKNKEQQRDPEMHQTKKRQSVALWHEGPHWCRCQEWPDPQPRSPRGQRA